ncbi:MAG: hypothetical protein AAF215_17375 [Cyanobacteria bacterium P01_A01_bin.123]
MVKDQPSTAIASINPSTHYALEMVLDVMRLVMGCDRVILARGDRLSP